MMIMLTHYPLRHIGGPEMAEMKFSTLDAEKLAKLKSFENELGSWILAVEPAKELADLSAAQLARLQALEEELGVVLLAYVPPA
jgi:hypothetical protein